MLKATSPSIYIQILLFYNLLWRVGNGVFAQLKAIDLFSCALFHLPTVDVEAMTVKWRLAR